MKQWRVNRSRQIRFFRRYIIRGGGFYPSEFSFLWLSPPAPRAKCSDVILEVAGCWWQIWNLSELETRKLKPEQLWLLKRVKESCKRKSQMEDPRFQLPMSLSDP